VPTCISHGLFDLSCLSKPRSPPSSKTRLESSPRYFFYTRKCCSVFVTGGWVGRLFISDSQERGQKRARFGARILVSRPLKNGEDLFKAIHVYDVSRRATPPRYYQRATLYRNGITARMQRLFVFRKRARTHLRHGGNAGSMSGTTDSGLRRVMVFSRRRGLMPDENNHWRPVPWIVGSPLVSSCSVLEPDR